MSTSIHDQTLAFVVADTVHPDVVEARITTVQYRAPRFLLAEINTHGLLAKSAASSRAIPVERRIKDVDNSPFVPNAFGRNKKGMQSETLLEYKESMEAHSIWHEAVSDAVKAARDLARLQVHKQTANRVLEPFAYVDGVLTATEWDNFYRLRLDKHAQPEFQTLARCIKKAIDESVPRAAKEHLPYIKEEAFELMPAASNQHWLADRSKAWRVSAARCARVSYVSNITGTASNFLEDDDLCSRLIGQGHMSPFDHIATADYIVRSGVDAKWASPGTHGRFWGWIPKRYDVERAQKLPPAKRDSFALFRSQNSSISPNATMVLAPRVEE